MPTNRSTKPMKRRGIQNVVKTNAEIRLPTFNNATFWNLVLKLHQATVRRQWPRNNVNDPSLGWLKSSLLTQKVYKPRITFSILLAKIMWSVPEFLRRTFDIRATM